MSNTKNKLEYFRQNILPITVQIVGVIVVIANLWLVTKLAPIEQNLTVMAQKVEDIKVKVDAVENQHNNFVQKDTFELLIERINHISSRVDSIYSIITR